MENKSTNGTSHNKTVNAYTNAPKLHANLILGSLQVLCWLFFHPSAWRNYVTRIDPKLHPDFCLAELDLSHCRDVNMRRLLTIQYIIWPIMISLLTSLTLWWRDMPQANIALGAGFSLSICVGTALGIGTTGSTIAGTITGMALGGGGGLLFGARNGFTGEVTASLSISVGLTVAFGASISLAASLAGNVGSRGTAYSLARQMSGVVVSVLLSGAALAVAIVVAGGVPVGIVGIAALGLAVGWRTRKWYRSVAFGLLLGAASGFSLDATSLVTNPACNGLVLGLGIGILISALYSLPQTMAQRIAGPWAGVVAGAVGFSSMGAMAALGLMLPLPILAIISWSLFSIPWGLTLPWWRPLLSYPFQATYNFLLYRADEQWATSASPCLLRWHSVFWDEFQRLRMPGLDDHIVLIMERNPGEGEAAIEYLNNSHQRWAAQSAQIEMDARGLERCPDITAISRAHYSLSAGDLEGPVSALLRSFSRVSQDVEAALRQESVFNQRLALNGVEDRLDGLLRELTRSGEPYAVRFRPIANRWRHVIAEHGRELARTVEARQEIDNPYVIGVPLTEMQEIFVGRTDVSARIEQLLLDRRRPPLLLYGQRRMGKTSLLTNLGRLLPSTIIPLFVDLQGPATQASDHAGFLYNIARGMTYSAQRQRDVSLPVLSRQALADDPFTCFDEWLDQVEDVLTPHTALLTLDEFEALDGALDSERFDEMAILGMLRHLIQHRPRFKVLLAGSHTLEELERWASYLINVQVVHIGYLREDEARQLIERPVEGFTLRYEPDACQRVLSLTRGHPALVQLLCAEIVALKNSQPPAVRRLACFQDVETAVPEALKHGSFFFADIERNQVSDTGRQLLRYLAAQGEETSATGRTLVERLPDFSGEASGEEAKRALDLLMRRELIEQTDQGYRFQVEIIRRWFAQPR